MASRTCAPKVLVRIAFISIAGETTHGEAQRILEVEVIDRSSAKVRVKATILGRANVAATAQLRINDVATLHGPRCSLHKNEKRLAVTHEDELHMFIIDRRSPIHSRVPEASATLLSTLQDLSQMATGTAALLVRVDRALPGSIRVTDHTGAAGTVQVAHRVDPRLFHQGMRYLLPSQTKRVES